MLDRINDIFWWTGSLVWLGVGGGIVLSMIASCYFLMGYFSWWYAKKLLGDLKGLYDVNRWIRAGRPKTVITTTKDEVQ